MSTGITMILVCLLSLVVTWFFFGRRGICGKKQKFLYWLKSTLLSSALVFLWVYCYDPEFPRVAAAILSLLLSALLTLLRSRAELILT